MQTVWIMQYKSTDADPGSKFDVALFPTRDVAQQFIDGSRDEATGQSGIVHDEPYEFGLEGVSAETYLHQALTAVWQLPPSRESSLVKTKIQEAQLWLDCTPKIAPPREELAQTPGA